ncbi:MAG TPA: hypothetical protein PKK43_12095, partial [Spirochaetota bacterium]|nr:hypothetical protein [Spirochaetota bacterium]
MEEVVIIHNSIKSISTVPSDTLVYSQNLPIFFQQKTPLHSPHNLDRFSDIIKRHKGGLKNYVFETAFTGKY